MNDRSRIRSSEITPESVYRSRREFLATLIGAGAFTVAGVLVHYARITAEIHELRRLRTENSELLSKTRTYEENAGKLQAKVLQLQTMVTKLGVMAGLEHSLPDATSAGVGGAVGTESQAPVLAPRAMAAIDESLTTLTHRSAQLEEFYRDQTLVLASTPSIWPVRGYLSAGFGNRKDPFTGQRDFHSGIDISTPIGTRIFAPADGVVLSAGVQGAYGNSIVVDHGYGVVTRYGHMDAFAVRAGQRVRRGDLIGFVARREQQGAKDDVPQFYVIAPDGGEARRVGHVATGVDAFRWFPDGRRVAFVSWVWPDAKGAAAQAARVKAQAERKESAYVTSEALYRFWDHSLPMGRVPQLHVLDVDSGRVRNLFEGSGFELERPEPDAKCFDIAPDGRRIVFAFDPADEKRFDNRFALAELDLKSGRYTTLVRDANWTFGAPRYSSDGDQVAFLARHDGLKHTMPA